MEFVVAFLVLLGVFVVVPTIAYFAGMALDKIERGIMDAIENRRNKNA